MEDLTTCNHPSIELGSCLECDARGLDEDLTYTPEPRKLTPRDVLSVEDLDMISELVAVATERREQQARDDVFEASYHRSRVKDYREFSNRMSGRTGVR